MKQALPARARVVVVGGGVVGCSTAYHLARRGWTDVVLLERKRLTSGTTEAIPGLPRGLPTIKTAPDYAYVRNEGAGLMVGFFEPGSYPWASRGIPADAEFTHLPEDWDHLGPFYEKMTKRLPVLAETGIRLHFCGPVRAPGRTGAL